MPTGVYDRTKSKPNSGLFKKGQSVSPETQFKKGRKPWSAGLKMTDEFKNKVSRSKMGFKPWNKGKENPNWKGEKNPRWNGGKRVHKYVFVKSINHPFADKEGYVREHRLVAEKALGRLLKKEETVHHRNKIKTDNRVENLMVFRSELAHRKFERYGSVGSEEIIFDGRYLRSV